MHQDREQIFADRYYRFKEIIKKYQDQQVELINQKARDEQQAEKNKILKDSKDRDETYFQKKQKSLETEVKIMKSRKINESRMIKMKLRYEFVERIQQNIKTALSQKIKEPKLYKALLKQLIVQGLIKMLEENVQVKCLRKDVSLVKQLVSQCQRQFNEMSSIQTKITVNQRQSLNDSDIGGVYITSNHGRIVCNNTLAARLDYTMQYLLPEIRQNLFNRPTVTDENLV